MLTHKEQSLLDALEPRAVAEGIEIVTLEVVGAKKAPTIRVYSSAQSWMGDLMDEIDPFPGAYTLEVSSPGIDRPLRTPEHFERFAGEKCIVKTTAPIDGRSSFSGELLGMKNGNVIVDVDGTEYAIPHEAVKKANVKGTFEFRS